LDHNVARRDVFGAWGENTLYWGGSVQRGVGRDWVQENFLSKKERGKQGVNAAVRRERDFQPVYSPLRGASM